MNFKDYLDEVIMRQLNESGGKTKTIVTYKVKAKKKIEDPKYKEPGAFVKKGLTKEIKKNEIDFIKKNGYTFDIPMRDYSAKIKVSPEDLDILEVTQTITTSTSSKKI